MEIILSVDIPPRIQKEVAGTLALLLFSLSSDTLSAEILLEA